MEQKAFLFTLPKIQTPNIKYLCDTWAYKMEELSDPILKKQNKTNPHPQ